MENTEESQAAAQRNIQACDDALRHFHPLVPSHVMAKLEKVIEEYSDDVRRANGLPVHR